MTIHELIELHGIQEALEIWRRENNEWYKAHPQKPIPVDELLEIECRQLGRPTFDEWRRI